MSELVARGKFILANCSGLMAPYPFNIAFVTTSDDWDAVVAYLHTTDPEEGLTKYLGHFEENRQYVSFTCEDQHWYLVGCKIVDIPYNHYYTGVVLGAAMDVSHDVIMNINERIGNDPTVASTTSAIMHDWFLFNWRASIANVHDTSLVFMPDEDCGYIRNNPGVLNQIMAAQDQLGSSLAVTCALQRECQRLLHTQVTAHNDHWSAVTYLSGAIS
ncbi:hypothetical protein AH06_241 [Erwinia phage AH06]|nr:hypothetical protein AH06_241 [Erwinia phage AH06]